MVLGSGHPQNSVDVKPMDFPAWYRRGEMLAEITHYEEALQCYEEALPLASFEERSQVLLGQVVCYLHLQRFHEALVSCDRILELAPDHSQAWVMKGIAAHRLGNYTLAYRCYDQAVGRHRSGLGARLQRLREWFQGGVAWLGQSQT